MSDNHNNGNCCDHKHDEVHNHDLDHGHDHTHGVSSGMRMYLPLLISGVLFLTGLICDYIIHPAFFSGYVRLFWYLAAYIPVGWPVAVNGFRLMVKGDVFTEFFLMTIATLGAFFIGEYPEGVAVMLFYTIGELCQELAVGKAKNNIKALLDLRPDRCRRRTKDDVEMVSPKDLVPGDTLVVYAGERIVADGILINKTASINPSALTGETTPIHVIQGEEIFAGMICNNKAIEIRVTKKYSDSALSKILKLVQDAAKTKAPTELFIRRFAKIYTPIVVALAIGIIALPFLLFNYVSGFTIYGQDQYIFQEWLYRALVFLVISCPCALVISIPLGYFGGIGAASQNGILFKGANYLDMMRKITKIVFDKTGTLTKGNFVVNGIEPVDMSETELLRHIASLEQTSSHPIARAILKYATDKNTDLIEPEHINEVEGYGIEGRVNGRVVIVGNARLFERYNIAGPATSDDNETTVYAIISGAYAGKVKVSDEIRQESYQAVTRLKQMNIALAILSGDKKEVTGKIAAQLGITDYYSGLLPGDKLDKLKQMKNNDQVKLAFAGDGINDAPVLAASDIGIAMGKIGSDIAIETANVVIQNDNPMSIPKAITISNNTHKIVMQNIALAFAVKLIVMIMGAGGIATMWEAVFADVGVALLAVLNATRIQKMRFD